MAQLRSLAFRDKITVDTACKIVLMLHSFVLLGLLVMDTAYSPGIRVATTVCISLDSNPFLVNALYQI